MQSGVPEAVALRLMGPLFLVEPIGDGNSTVTSLVPSGRKKEKLPIAAIPDLELHDTFVVENLDNGELGCGYVTASGTARAAAPSDEGHRLKLRFFEGNVLVPGSDKCRIKHGAVERTIVASFGHGYPVPEPTEPDEEPEGYFAEFHGRIHNHGEQLVALAHGLGFKRGTPEMRRMLSIAQAIVDSADPAVLGRHMLVDPLVYESTGESTGASVMNLAMVGDMVVPVSTSAALGRTQGLVGYLEDDPRYGKPQNQLLIDTYTLEAVHDFGRYRYGDESYTGTEYSKGVHLDIENFSQGTDVWGSHLPRLDPPLRLYGADRWGGESGHFFGLPRPQGEHGFPLPYELRTKLRKACEGECPTPEDEAEECPECDACIAQCNTLETFEPSFMYMNMIGHYVGTTGRDIAVDLCMGYNNCDCDPAVDGEYCVRTPPAPPERAPEDFE